MISGVLQVLIFPLPGVHLLCWISTTPLLLAILRARRPDTLQLADSPASRLIPATPAQAFVLGYASGILWYAGTCYWVYDTMHQYGGLSAPAAFVILLLFCVYLALYQGALGCLVALAADRGSPFHRRALIMAPFLWVALELVRTRLSGFPWNLLGTVEVDNVPLARIATFIGVYGISFEIMLVNAAIAAAFVVPRDRRKALLVACVASVFVLEAGRWLPLPAEPADRTAYLVQGNIPILDSSRWTKEYFEGTLRDLGWISLHEPARALTMSSAPNLIVWPESPAPFYSSDPFFRNAASQTALRSDAWLISGSVGIENARISPLKATEAFNSAVLVSPDGQWVSRYDKVHLVPFGEYVPFEKLLAFAGGLTKEVGDFRAGTSREPLDAGGVKLGVFICYESIFPDEVRQFARNGAQVFVNISNDGWYGDSGAYAQHLNQSRMRAIENRRWLLLDTNTGVTASVDPEGRIVRRLERKFRGTLVAPYALTSVTTFYTRHGDWFAYLCAIISAGILFWGIAFTRAQGNRYGRGTRTGVFGA
ncbi:MAG: apolipoprotein N-acyltransferase [Acidobacteria bacterium]|nr:apolipoprotein N-acyltransferase [Acidobacteriota bacterium]